MGNGTEGNADEAPAPRGRVPSTDELRRRFFFKPPRDEEAIEHHKLVSDLAFSHAVELVRICPPGRNLSLALTALEEVRMRANAAIAVDDPRP